MKYMGSKRWMLKNGLGDLICAESSKATRFVDLFAGSGIVACFVAKNTNLPVLAFDLQSFAVVLTEAIIGRDSKADGDQIWKDWYEAARNLRQTVRVPRIRKLTRGEVKESRAWSQSRQDQPITKAYGGHYFNPLQGIWLDAFRKTLPKDEPNRSIALAALIDAASRCAAAPGHTAQPFQPTRTAKIFLKEAWSKDITIYAHRALTYVASQHARVKGQAQVGDANLAAKQLQPGDLVFIDPPYSGVQYSRFYHVLETIAQGTPCEVSGRGRYPALELRPQSKYSSKKQSLIALKELLETIAQRKISAILTFPNHTCSNGLSGKAVKRAAIPFFDIKAKIVSSKFSTLGGNSRLPKTNGGREARQVAKELILVLRPINNAPASD